MRIEDIQFLYEYNYWANHKILAAAGMLTEEQYLAPRTYSHGGVRDTLVHILSAEWIWRVRCEEQLFPTAVPSAEDFPSLESLRQRWQKEEGRMRGWFRVLITVAFAAGDEDGEAGGVEGAGEGGVQVLTSVHVDLLDGGGASEAGQGGQVDPGAGAAAGVEAGARVGLTAGEGS